MTCYSIRNIKIKDSLPKNTFFRYGYQWGLFLFQTYGTGKPQNFEQGIDV